MYLFFDTETTGLPRNSHASIKELENWPRVVQLAWLTYSNTGKLLSENDYIIKPSSITCDFNKHVNPKIIQRKARHSKIETTLQYDHVTDEMVREYFEKR